MKKAPGRRSPKSSAADDYDPSALYGGVRGLSSEAVPTHDESKQNIGRKRTSRPVNAFPLSSDAVPTRDESKQNSGRKRTVRPDKALSSNTAPTAEESAINIGRMRTTRPAKALTSDAERRIGERTHDIRRK